MAHSSLPLSALLLSLAPSLFPRRCGKGGRRDFYPPLLAPSPYLLPRIWNLPRLNSWRENHQRSPETPLRKMVLAFRYLIDVRLQANPSLVVCPSAVSPPGLHSTFKRGGRRRRCSVGRPIPPSDEGPFEQERTNGPSEGKLNSCCVCVGLSIQQPTVRSPSPQG